MIPILEKREPRCKEGLDLSGGRLVAFSVDEVNRRLALLQRRRNRPAQSASQSGEQQRKVPETTLARPEALFSGGKLWII